MSYGSAAGANALVQSWNGTTQPTTAQVGLWLVEGNAIINRALAAAGYSTPITDTTIAAYPELTALENLYAAAYILRSLAVDTASGETEDRSEVWLADFWTRLRDLAASNLTLLGLTLLASITSTRRTRIRTLQMRKVDGYSRGATDDTWEVTQGEYSGVTAPSE